MGVSKKQIIVFVCLTILVFSCGGLFGYFTSDNSKQYKEKSNSPFLDAGDTMSDVIPKLDYFFISIKAQVNETKFVKLKLAIKTNKSNKKYLNFEKNHLKHEILLMLSDQPKQEFETTWGRLELKEKILETIKKKLPYDVKVNNVYYVKFLLYET